MTGQQYCMVGMAVLLCIVVAIYEVAVNRLEKRLREAYRRL